MDKTQDNPQFASLGDEKARLFLSIEFERPGAALRLMLFGVSFVITNKREYDKLDLKLKTRLAAKPYFRQTSSLNLGHGGPGALSVEHSSEGNHSVCLS